MNDTAKKPSLLSRITPSAPPRGTLARHATLAAGAFAGVIGVDGINQLIDNILASYEHYAHVTLYDPTYRAAHYLLLLVALYLAAVLGVRVVRADGTDVTPDDGHLPKPAALLNANGQPLTETTP